MAAHFVFSVNRRSAARKEMDQSEERRPKSLRGRQDGHADRLIHQAGNLAVVVEHDPLNDSLLFKRQDQLRRTKAFQLAGSALVDALEGTELVVHRVPYRSKLLLRNRVRHHRIELAVDVRELAALKIL